MEKLNDNEMEKYEKFRKIESLLNEAKNSFSEAVSMEYNRSKSMPLRTRYVNAVDKTLDNFGYESVEVENASMEELDEVYSDWKSEVNMNASQLRKWSKNPCSREASVDPVAVIKRNLSLLEKNKSEWTKSDIADAKRTISFISRMKPNQPDQPRAGPHGCPSERAISLLNWAYNPFDSVPTPNKEVNEDLDMVSEVTLSEKNSYEFEPVPDQVLYKERSDAEERARDLGLSGVHEHDLDGETMYMPGETHRDWVERVKAYPDKESMNDSNEVSTGDYIRHEMEKGVMFGVAEEFSDNVIVTVLRQDDEEWVETENSVELEMSEIEKVNQLPSLSDWL